MNRVCKILDIKSGEYKAQPFEKLKEGDTFQLYEPYGELVGVYVCKSEPYETEGVYGVVCEPLED